MGRTAVPCGQLRSETPAPRSRQVLRLLYDCRGECHRCCEGAQPGLTTGSGAGHCVQWKGERPVPDVPGARSCAVMQWPTVPAAVGECRKQKLRASSATSALSASGHWDLRGEPGSGRKRLRTGIRSGSICERFCFSPDKCQQQP